MDYQGSVYYYDGYSNFMKGKSQFQGENLEADSGASRDWFVGYRHAMADHHCRVKRELDNVAHQFDSSSQQFESLATKQHKGWNGEGLPPVGTECEWLASGDHDWMKVRVLAYHEDEVWLQPLNGAQSFSVGNPDDFRLIPTEAERRRHVFAKSLCDHLDDLTEWDSPVGKVHALAIYDAIADGQIPGVKLESTHE